MSARPAEPALAAVPGLEASVRLDVWRLRPRDAVRAMIASATYPRRTARGPVGFAKLLGSGDARFTPGSADLTRWVTLTVHAPGSAPTDPAPPAWARHALGHWSARLAPLAARGRWSGQAPFTPPARSVAAGWTGEVLALTRARIRPQRIPTFWRAVPPVAESLRAVDGLRATIGIGEAPVGFQGTLSWWEDAAAVAAFAWRDPAHRAVVDRTPGEQWYSEELFARFAVVDSRGSLSVWTDRRAATSRGAAA